MKKGDVVEWESQAGGFYKTKRGEIVAVIKPGEHFGYGRHEQFGAKSAFGYGIPRKHESYAVLVPHPRDGKPTLYWPIVSKLRKVG